MPESLDLLKRIEALEDELARLKNMAGERPVSAADTAVPAAAGSRAGADPIASRRDVLRYGALALGAAAAAGTMVPEQAEAADGGGLIIGAVNNGTNPTQLMATASYAFIGTTSQAGFAGVAGQGPGFGTYGLTTGTAAAGIFGFAPSSSGTSDGVRGQAISPDGVGVRGICSAGNAVRAEVPSTSNQNAIAMYALNYSSYAGAAPGAGGFAIYGLSAKGHGLVGATASAGAAAVVGATNGVANAYAAAFYGPVVVGGDLTVVGGAKSAAVPHPDGSHRRLYCLESPESWFEDFGRGTLTCGEAHIRFDRDFAAVADTSEYHVFLTGHDGRFDLTVAGQTPDGFRVKAAGEGDGTFSWRVVARRRDIAGHRFEPVAIPQEPELPAVPLSAVEQTGGLPGIPRAVAPPASRR